MYLSIVIFIKFISSGNFCSCSINFSIKNLKVKESGLRKESNKTLSIHPLLDSIYHNKRKIYITQNGNLPENKFKKKKLTGNRVKRNISDINNKLKVFFWKIKY